MRLLDLHFRCLCAAAHSREIIKREWLLDAMTVVNEYAHEIQTDKEVHVNSVLQLEKAITDAEYGQVVRINHNFIGVVFLDQQMLLSIGVLSRDNQPMFHRLDTFEFKNAIAREYFGDCALTKSNVQGVTTVGRFLENMITVQIPTGYNVFQYDNSVWSVKGIMKKMTDALSNKQIDVEQYRKFVDYFFYLNHISEICVPSLSVKSLTTDPRVSEVKAKFIKEHQGQMNDPFVIKELEDMLCKMDKEYLGDDPSVTFFDGLGKKSYQIHRKKLFLMVGGIPAFDESTGKYDFNPNSLMDGWTMDVLPSIANEIRKGSYERGRETAKGGAETKLVYRVFQDLVIDKDDCGTKRTIRADFKNTFRIKDFIGRTINVNGADVILTPENISKYDGQVVQLYSPLTCENKYNLCYKCCGQHCKEFGVRLIGTQTVKITSQFMQTAMKNMHGTVLQTMRPKLADVLL